MNPEGPKSLYIPEVVSQNYFLNLLISVNLSWKSQGVIFMYEHSGGASPSPSWDGRRDYPKIQRNNVGLAEFRLNLNKSRYLLLSYMYKVRSDLNEVKELILSTPAYTLTGQKLKPCG